MKPFDKCRTFEQVDAILNSSNISIRIIIAYGPSPWDGNRATVALFLDEFTSFLEELAVYGRKILITGAFPFHVDVQ